MLGSTLQAVRDGNLVSFVRKKPAMLDWAVGMCLSMIAISNDDDAAAASSLKALLSETFLACAVDEAMVIRRLSRIIATVTAPAALSLAIDVLWSLAFSGEPKITFGKQETAGEGPISPSEALRIAFARLVEVVPSKEPGLAAAAMAFVCRALDEQPSATVLLLSPPEQLRKLVAEVVGVLRDCPDTPTAERALGLLSRLFKVHSAHSQQEQEQDDPDASDKLRRAAIESGLFPAVTKVLSVSGWTNGDVSAERDQASRLAPSTATALAHGAGPASKARADRVQLAIDCLDEVLMSGLEARVRVADGSPGGDASGTGPEVAVDHPEAAGVAVALIALLDPNGQDPNSNKALPVLMLMLTMTQNASVWEAAEDALLRWDRSAQLQALLSYLDVEIGELEEVEQNAMNVEMTVGVMRVCRQLALKGGFHIAEQLRLHAPNLERAAINYASACNVASASRASTWLADEAVILLLVLANPLLGDHSDGKGGCGAPQRGATAGGNEPPPALLLSLARLLLKRAAAGASAGKAGREQDGGTSKDPQQAAGTGSMYELRWLTRCWEVLGEEMPRPSERELQRLSACVDRALAATQVAPAAEPDSLEMLLRLTALIISQGVDGTRTCSRHHGSDADEDPDAAAGCVVSLAIRGLEASMATDAGSSAAGAVSLCRLLTAANKLGRASVHQPAASQHATSSATGTLEPPPAAPSAAAGGLDPSPGMDAALREALTRGCAHAVQLLTGPAGQQEGAVGNSGGGGSGQVALASAVAEAMRTLSDESRQASAAAQRLQVLLAEERADRARLAAEVEQLRTQVRAQVDAAQRSLVGAREQAVSLRLNRLSNRDAVHAKVEEGIDLARQLLAQACIYD